MCLDMQLDAEQIADRNSSYPHSRNLDARGPPRQRRVLGLG